MPPSTSSKVETEKALTEAVHRGEFVLAFQPQMSLVTGEVVGAEALLRWNHPRDGLRMPDSFIPIAEKTGVIAEIGEWVMGEVAAVVGGWCRNGNARRLAFNVSPRQLDRADFFAKLRQSFADAQVPLSLIELEFTESAAMEVSESVLAEIAALARRRRDHRHRRFRNRLLEPRAAALDAARPGQARPVADRRHRALREGPSDCPGRDPADQGRRVRDRRRSGGDRRPGRHPARDGLRHRPGICIRPAMFEDEFLAWTGNADRSGAKSVA